MKRLKRVVLGNRVLHVLLSRMWHAIQNTCTRLCFIFSKTEYFSPLAPHGLYKSQYGQDQVLERLGLLRHGATFVEVGCNHPVNGSNSYYLEKAYNYSGVSIDVVDYGLDFSRLRMRTKFINCAIDATSEAIDMYFVPEVDGWETQMTTAHVKTLHSGRGFEGFKRSVPAITLQDAFANLDHVDVLMVDVEGHEFEVLRSLDWSRQSPRVVLIENNGVNFSRSSLREYMSTLRYKLVAVIGSHDDIYCLR